IAFLLAACEVRFVPSVQDFDNKITEADAYLQILIEQLKLFDDKLQNCKDDEQRKKIETLKETTNSVVESIKHCIVLITINPVDAICQSSPWEPVISTMSSQTVLPPEPAQLCKSEQRPFSLPVGPVLATLGHHQTPTPNSTGSGHSPPRSSLTSPSHVNLSPNTVPEFSYSSSEDKFYDADKFHQSSSSPKHLIDSSGSVSVLTHISSGNSLKCPDTTESLNSSMSNSTSDADLFDSHDDRDDDRDAGQWRSTRVLSCTSCHRLGSEWTFLHILTLTRKIPGRKDRWVDKKPYNPILGEIFQCHWTLNLVSEGPVPCVFKNSITFVAEQVSHHPAISAFCAECFNKKIQFSAHIWSKSKFLGMSIGVHDIGQGCVSCLGYDEHYILTFPNGYGRSILTVPWVELGGESRECNINSSKTGYSTNIVFHTKPFYGGKKHRITKSFCSIEGEWSGVMYAKYAIGENTVFVDTKKLPIIKKKVRKLEDQNEYESCCLWKDVTFNLKIRDIDVVTEAKHRHEERPRAET
ncbi:OSBPL9, partial [Ictidomys tridecemlineatus]|uniref:Oxysterol-binding protein n=1 Tax=Ictidomys tridecemlineatus TaxID=43179 RepID=A0A287D3A2_ICTTR